MSDESRIARPNEQDEPADEVRRPREAGRQAGRRVDKVGVADEGADDEVEGHAKMDSPRTTEKSLQRAKSPASPGSFVVRSVEQLLERAQEGETCGLPLFGCVLELGREACELALAVECCAGTPGALEKVERDGGLIAEQAEQVHLCEGEGLDIRRSSTSSTPSTRSSTSSGTAIRRAGT